MPQKNFFDIWLIRLSYISQFGLFLLTLGALYFTVLPLYQKALLEEAIARKELELRQTNAELEKTYASVREFAVSEYVFYAGAKCTGMLEKTESLLKIGEHKPIKLTLAERIFAIDIGTCLEEAMKQKTFLGELRIGDFDFLIKRIAEVSSRLANKRRQAMLDYRNTSERERLNPGSLPPPTGLVAQYLEIVAKFYADMNGAVVPGHKLKPPMNFEQRKRELAIEEEQTRVALRYADEIRKELVSLRTLKWPNEVEL